MSNEVLETHPSWELSVFRLFLNHWRVSTIVVFSCIGMAGLMTLIMPRRYESRMRFLVSNERADLVISPEKNQSSTQPAEVTENQVNSEMELMKSRDILETVIRDQDLYLSRQEIASAKPSNIQLARAVQKLEKNLSVSALRKTNIVEVVFAAPDPNSAVSVLNDLGERYLAAHLAAHSTPGTYKFFTEQVSKYSDQLIHIRSTISTFHREMGLYSMPEQQAAALEAFQTTECRLNDVDVELEADRARLAEAGRQLAASPERVTTQVRTVPNQLAVQQLQTALTELRNKRIELAMKFKPADRLLTELDDQIANTSNDLNELKGGSAEERTTDFDTVREAIKADYARGRINYQGLQKQRSELSRVRAVYLNRLRSMDAQYLRLQNLEQLKKEAQDNYELYVHRLDEARLADLLDREKFSNVSLIEKPLSSPIPVSPKLGLNLAVGFIVGVLLALTMSFVMESKGSNGLPVRRAEKIVGDFVPPRAFQTASGD